MGSSGSRLIHRFLPRWELALRLQLTCSDLKIMASFLRLLVAIALLACGVMCANQTANQTAPAPGPSTAPAVGKASDAYALNPMSGASLVVLSIGAVSVTLKW